MKAIRNISALITGLSILAIITSGIVLINQAILLSIAPPFVLYVCILFNSSVTYFIFDKLYKVIDGESPTQVSPIPEPQDLPPRRR